MKKLILMTGLFVFLSQVVSAQWVSNFGGHNFGDNSFASAKGMADVVDVNGNCIVTGYCHDDATGDNIITIKYNPQGDTLWTRTYNGSGNSEDRAFGVCCDAAGNIYVTGYASVAGEGANIALIKYDAQGNEQWAVIYNGTGNEEDKAFGIAVDAVGNIYITGYRTSSQNDADIITMKCSPTGSIVWTAVYQGDNNSSDKGTAITVDGWNNVYVTGYAGVQGNGNDIITIKYNASGQLIWTKRYDKHHLDDRATSIGTDASGNVYVAGYVSADANNIDCVLLKYTSWGSQAWDKTYNNGGNGSEDKAFGMVLDAVTGSVYVTGKSGSSTNTDYVTIKYNAFGSRVWVSSYSGTGNGNDEATAIALVDGNVVVTGSTLNTNNNDDYTTIKYSSSNGSQLQVSTYGLTSNSEDVAKAIAVNIFTNAVYITGFSELLINGAFSQSYISTQSLQMGEKIEITNTEQTASDYTLHQNYPNPFNPTTTIKFDIVKASKVKLAVYDILGKEITVLVNEFMNAGKYEAVFTSTNIPSGTYFYVLTADGYRDVKKMTLVK
jgi:uncharacterized delta-60 repeat protein